MTVSGIGLYLFAEKFVALFCDNAQVSAEFLKVAAVLALPLPLGGISSVVDGSLLGASRFRFVSLNQVAFAVLATSLLFFFHKQNTLTLFSTSIFVRLGLSGTILSSLFVAFAIEYRGKDTSKMG